MVKKIRVNPYSRGGVRIVPKPRSDRGSGQPPFHKVRIVKTQWEDRFNQFVKAPKKKRFRTG